MNPINIEKENAAKKYKEFWINEDSLAEDLYEAFETRTHFTWPGTKTIHVIEYSAIESLTKENAALKAALGWREINRNKMPKTYELMKYSPEFMWELRDLMKQEIKCLTKELEAVKAENEKAREVIRDLIHRCEGLITVQCRLTKQEDLTVQMINYESVLNIARIFIDHYPSHSQDDLDKK